MRPGIRRATMDDIPFLGWVMFTAAPAGKLFAQDI